MIQRSFFWIYNIDGEEIGQRTIQLVKFYCKEIGKVIKMKFEHQESFRKKVGSYGPYITRPLLLTHVGNTWSVKVNQFIGIACLYYGLCDKNTFSHNFILFGSVVK